MRNNRGWGVILLAVLFVLFLIAIGPILTIWAVNTLFPAAAIPYDIYTWVSVIILGAFFRANVTVKRKD
jgi:hypothetical protein